MVTCEVFGQLCVESPFNFSTLPTQHSSAPVLNFTHKSCIFNFVLQNLEPHCKCIWSPVLASA